MWWWDGRSWDEGRRDIGSQVEVGATLFLLYLQLPKPDNNPVLALH